MLARPRLLYPYIASCSKLTPGGPFAELPLLSCYAVSWFLDNIGLITLRCMEASSGLDAVNPSIYICSEHHLSLFDT